MSLNLTDTSGLLATARDRAVADARAKAGPVRQRAGPAAGPVISITDQSRVAPVPVFADFVGGQGPVPISPGSQQLSVPVTVVYALG